MSESKSESRVYLVRKYRMDDTYYDLHEEADRWAILSSKLRPVVRALWIAFAITVMLDLAVGFLVMAAAGVATLAAELTKGKEERIRFDADINHKRLVSKTLRRMTPEEAAEL